MLGTPERPVRIAIIGAGPAAFYAAESLLKHKELACSIDFFNRYPYPFGLVREGVAPDHQSIKAVTRVYDKIAANPNVRYFGNVTFGLDITHEDIKPLYDQIIYAVGAQSDRRMGIPGEELAGSLPATEFVAWYNGRPDAAMHTFDLSCERVIVVGNGNVAMDVARILVTDPDELATTDIADHALAALRASKVREVVMLGRRGPAQAAFTTPELKEFGELHGVDVLVDAADLELDAISAATVQSDKTAARNVELLRNYAARSPTGAPRRIQMRFMASPVEVLGSDGKVSGVRIEKNALVADENGALKAKGTGVFEQLAAGMILRSVGYKGVPLVGVPFDESTNTIANVAGRVVRDNTGEPVSGEYVVGWIKRGPSGIIGTNKPDAAATVAAMIEDLADLSGISDDQRDPQIVAALVKQRKPDVVGWPEWQVLDAHETALGSQQGRPRIKVTDVAAMLDIIGTV